MVSAKSEKKIDFHEGILKKLKISIFKHISSKCKKMNQSVGLLYFICCLHSTHMMYCPVSVMVVRQTVMLDIASSSLATVLVFFAFYGNFWVLGVPGTLTGSSPPQKLPM